MANKHGKLKEVNRNIFRRAANGHLCFEIDLGYWLIPELLPMHIDFIIFLSVIKHLSNIFVYKQLFYTCKSWWWLISEKQKSFDVLVNKKLFCSKAALN